MVSVAELLNPEPPRAPLPSSRPASHSPPAGQTAVYRNEAAPATRPSIEMLRMTENLKGHPRSKIKGAVKYPPFEALDEASLHLVRKFQVHPFGSIQETSERIPYNSGKKDFFSKTGREGFEVFRYDFTYKEKPEDDDTTYTVMWDYNVGFVRMTPFFRCRGFPKTAPAKMLNSNPGLKEITHGITGGSIKAQGYWMPYSCAKAVCATFCAKIAGALIPLFGPRFPYECVPEGAPGYDRMIISQDIVNRARREAAARFGPRSALLSPRPSRSLSPQRPTRIPDIDDDRRLLLSPYTDTDVEYHPVSEPYARRMYPPVPRTRPPTSAPAPGPTPLASPTWAAHHLPLPPPQYPAGEYHHRDISQLNEDLLGLNVSSTAHPWLSAVPRSPTPGGKLLHPCYPRLHPHHHHHTSPQSREWNINLPPIRLKRGYDQVDPDSASVVANNNHKRDTGNGDEVDSGRRRSPSSSTLPKPSTTSSYYHDSWARHHHLQPHQQPQEDTPPPPKTPPGSEHTESESVQSAQSAQSALLSAVSSPSDITHKHNARPEAERDAAIMLMQMRADSSSGSASATPSPRSGSSASFRESTSPVLPLHHRHRRSHRRGEADAEEQRGEEASGRPTTQHGRGGRGGDGEGNSINVRLAQVGVTGGHKKQRSHAAGPGPCTRVKRRRTSSEC